MRRAAHIAPLTAGLLVVAASLAHAGGYAGFKGGVNLASFVGPSVDSTAAFGGLDPTGEVVIEEQTFPGSRTGFTGGGFIGFDSGKHLGFRADLLYTMKGATNGEVTIKLDYIELGTVLVWRTTLTERFTLRAFAGPMVGVFVNAEGDSGPVDIDFGDIVHHWEFSGTGGVELDVNTGPYIVLLEARYTLGSRVFDETNLDGDPLDYTVSNSGIGVMAGMMVPF